MKSNFENTDLPHLVSNVKLHVYGPKCLFITFDEPVIKTSALIYKYMSERKFQFDKN